MTAFEDRLRSAMVAEAATVEPPDAWPTIVSRLDRRPSRWAWVTQRPVLVGAAAVALVVFVLAGLTLLGGDESAQDLKVVNPPEGQDFVLVAATTDGRLLELAPHGAENRVISSSFALDESGGSLLARPYLAIAEWPADGSVDPATQGDVHYLENQVRRGDLCPDGESRVFTGIQFTGIDGQVYDRDPRPLIDPATVFALSPDSRYEAYVTTTTSDLDALAEGAPDPSCGTEPMVLEVRDRVTDEVVMQVDIKSDLDVWQLVWLPDGRLAVLAGPAAAAASAQPADVHLLDPLADATQLGDPTGIEVWSGRIDESVLSDDGVSVVIPEPVTSDAAGDLLIAGSGWARDSSPFTSLTGPVRGEGSADVNVWRGSLAGGGSEHVATIGDLDWWEIDRDSGADVVPVDLTAGSLVSAPDGSIYLTVVGRVGGVDEPDDVALFRITLDGKVERLADGIVAVAVRPLGDTDDEVPESEPEAGPVVGARPDGSLALLDPATGEIDRELTANEDYPGAAYGLNDAVLREVAVAPGGEVVWQARPDHSLDRSAGLCPGFIAAWDVYGVDPADGGVVPLFDGSDRPPSRMPTPSPDGEHLAYVTTSNGTRCDDALVIAVASDPGDGPTTVATHTLPVGVMPHQITWWSAGQLSVLLPAGDGELTAVLVDPLVGGPVDVAGATTVAEPVLVAAGADGPVVIDRTTEAQDVGGGTELPEGEVAPLRVSDGLMETAGRYGWSVPLPIEDDDAVPTSLALDRATQVWTTIERPSADEGERDVTYLLPEADHEPVEVTGGFVAIAATPFGPPESGESGESGDTTTTEPDTTDVTIHCSSTAPDGCGRAYPGFVYVTQDGTLYHRGPHDESGFGTFVADGFASPQPSSPLGHTIAVEPDGTHAYLTRWPDGAGLCESEIVRVGLPDSEDADVGDAEVIMRHAADPALSPDGTKLAFLETGSELATPGGPCQATLVVRDLASGADERWPQETPSGGGGVSAQLSHPSWFTDAILGVQSTTVGTGRRVLVLDTSLEPGLLEVRRIDDTTSVLRLDPDHPNTGDVTLLGAWDYSPVVARWCGPTEFCAYIAQVIAVTDPGEPADPVDVATPDGFVDGVWGPAGLLTRSSAACPEIGQCAGYDLVWSPIGGLDPVPLALEPKIHSVAWLP